MRRLGRSRWRASVLDSCPKNRRTGLEQDWGRRHVAQVRRLLDPTQRFGTTTNRYYTPIIYEPNKPCRRENVSDSTRLRKRQALKAARKARGRYHRDRYAENRLFEEQTRIHTSVRVIAATALLDGVVARPHRRGATTDPHAIAATASLELTRALDAGFMNEEQKVKEKAKAMLDYFQTTYERDLFATRCQPPENMQRKSNKVLYDRMWGGSRQNMLHSVNKKNLGYPPTTEMLRRTQGCSIISPRRGRATSHGARAARGGAAGARHGSRTVVVVSSVVYFWFPRGPRRRMSSSQARSAARASSCSMSTAVARCQAPRDPCIDVLERRHGLAAWA